MSCIPVLHYRPSHLPAAQAFEQWRDLMSPLFRIENAGDAPALPRGSSSTFLLETLLCNRTAFNAQLISRERKRIEETPDHLVLQYYISGGFTGELGGKSVSIKPGQVAVCDLARSLDVRASSSDTIGLAIPKHLLTGSHVARLAPRLSKDRERLLAAHMRALYRQVPHVASENVEAMLNGNLAFLLRLFDPSEAADVLEGPEFQMALVELAEGVIRARIGSNGLSPSKLADRIGVSRATLYRAFAPLGGIARRIQDLRLDAVREALTNPLDTRSVGELAAAYGFATAAHLSRSFRARFGQTPRAARRNDATEAENGRRPATVAVQRWWSQLADRRDR